MKTGDLGQVGEWQLHARVSAGEWAEVFLCSPAECHSSNADYVLKRIRKSHESDSLAIDLLRKEAAIGRKVVHANLASILAAHVKKPPYYLVMPFVAGSTLRTRMADGFSLPHAFWIVRQVAEALVSLHAQGWLHCDIKPENVYVAESGHTLLLDLGLAQTRYSAQRHAFVGTPNYAAPEWRTSATSITAACDVFGLGVTLFEMITGHLPRHAGQPLPVNSTNGIPDARRFVPDLPPRVARLLRTMLASEPLRRPSADELVDWIVDLEIDFLGDRLVA